MNIESKNDLSFSKENLNESKVKLFPEANISSKKAYQLFSDAKEYEENNYDSDKDNENLIKFDEELTFKTKIKGVDLVFLIDATGSMNPYMKGTKLFIRKTIKDALRCLTQYKINDDELLRVALVCYRDHPPEGKSPVTYTNDFTNDTIGFKEMIKSICAKGGGDESEAVLDGLDEVVNSLTWRKDSEKLVFHILDAPPHGSIFNNEKDNHPDGCTCSKDYESILSEMREKEIDYSIIKLSPSVDKMIEVFSNYIEINVLTLDLKPDPNKSSDQSN